MRYCTLRREGPMRLRSGLQWRVGKGVRGDQMLLAAGSAPVTLGTSTWVGIVLLVVGYLTSSRVITTVL